MTIEKTVHCLLASDYPQFEVIVVDNAADPATREALQRLPASVRLIHSPVNRGFAGGNNLGLSEARGEIIALLNDDTEVQPQWLGRLVAALLQRPDVGLVGSLILEADGGHIQHSGSRFAANYLNAHIDKGEPFLPERRLAEPIQRDYVMGAAIALRKSLLQSLEGLAECYLPGYYEDSELCYRVRALGLRIEVIPTAIVVHHEKQTLQDYSSYLRAYHRNRWLFVLRNLPVSEIIRAGFAEVRWVLNVTRWRDYRHHRPLLHAYAWNLLHLPQTLLARWRLQRANRLLKTTLR